MTPHLNLLLFPVAVKKKIYCYPDNPGLLSCYRHGRCREKQRKESSRLQALNRKLTAMNKLLMEENDRLQKQVSQLVYENGYYRQQTQSVRVPCALSRLFLGSTLPTAKCEPKPTNPPLALQAGLATTDTSCESVVTSGGQQQNVAAAAAQPQPQAQPRDASPAGYAYDSFFGSTSLLPIASPCSFLPLICRALAYYLVATCMRLRCLCRLMSIAEETLTEFLSKATGTAVEWVQMPGMKVGYTYL
jgi:homeobox-leucine zipper protein